MGPSKGGALEIWKPEPVSPVIAMLAACHSLMMSMGKS
jgi:hypothetical protein